MIIRESDKARQRCCERKAASKAALRRMLGFVVVCLLCVALGAGLGVAVTVRNHDGGNRIFPTLPHSYMGIPVRDCAHLYSGSDEVWFACMGVQYVEPN